jgi:long-chain acyl-CoA synthetase
MPPWPTTIAADTLALQRLYHWEKTTPDRVALTQPLGGGAVRDYTWREVLDQSAAWPRTCRAWG